jgi:hypothetical protein
MHDHEPKNTAKLCMHRRSQAVRLPKEFRLEGTEVRVSQIVDKAPSPSHVDRCAGETPEHGRCHQQPSRVRARAGLIVTDWSPDESASRGTAQSVVFNLYSGW